MERMFPNYFSNAKNQNAKNKCDAKGGT